MLSSGADERAALQFEDLASALDAGLPLQSLGGKPGQDERAVHELLRARGVQLSSTEDAVLLASWRAGRIGDGLRARAAERQRRVEFRRTIWRGLAYPIVLFTMILVAGFVSGPIVGHYWIPLGVLAALAVLGLFAFAARRGLRAGDERWTRLPLLGPIVTDLAELPYLETLHAMYGAGVPLLQAHKNAVAAIPVTSIQKRLRVADSVLQGGRSLTESLAQALALQPETRSLLATGEQAGQLEDALRRALARRRDVVSRSIAAVARRAGILAYAIAALAVAAIFLTFWTSYFARLGIGR